MMGRRSPSIGIDEVGFSLVEMSVVLVLMSIMLTVGIAAFTAQMENAVYSTTTKRMEVVRGALIAHLRDHGYLPCPDTKAFDNDPANPPGGDEKRDSGKCASYVGTLPFRNLGLSRDMALDGYGNFFTYFVSASGDNTPDWTRAKDDGATTIGFVSGALGRFAITEKPAPGIENPISGDASGYPVPALAAAVLISHGPNGLGAFGAKGTRNSASTDGDEVANSPPAAIASAPAWGAPTLPSGITRGPGIISTLVDGEKTDAYDDIVMAIRPNEFIGPLITDGSLKSPRALVQEKVDAIKVKLLANIAPTCTPTSCSVTYAPSGSDAVDPWGGAIQISGWPDTLTKSAVPDITLTSYGPDRSPGGSDDIEIKIPAIDIINAVGLINIPP